MGSCDFPEADWFIGGAGTALWRRYFTSFPWERWSSCLPAPDIGLRLPFVREKRKRPLRCRYLSCGNAVQPDWAELARALRSARPASTPGGLRRGNPSVLEVGARPGNGDRVPFVEWVLASSPVVRSTSRTRTSWQAERRPGRRYLLGSNYDWGQDLFRLKAWSEGSPDRQPIAICYYGALAPESLQVRTVGLPESFVRVDHRILPRRPRTDRFPSTGPSAGTSWRDCQ